MVDLGGCEEEGVTEVRLGGSGPGIGSWYRRGR